MLFIIKHMESDTESLFSHGLYNMKAMSPFGSNVQKSFSQIGKMKIHFQKFKKILETEISLSRHKQDPKPQNPPFSSFWVFHFKKAMKNKKSFSRCYFFYSLCYKNYSLITNINFICFFYWISENFFLSIYWLSWFSDINNRTISNSYNYRVNYRFKHPSLKR